MQYLSPLANHSYLWGFGNGRTGQTAWNCCGMRSLKQSKRFVTSAEQKQFPIVSMGWRGRLPIPCFYFSRRSGISPGWGPPLAFFFSVDLFSAVSGSAKKNICGFYFCIRSQPSILLLYFEEVNCPSPFLQIVDNIWRNVAKDDICMSEQTINNLENMLQI